MRMTIATLVTLGAVDQLRLHVGFARDNGVTETEIVEAITHLAFYVGWPRTDGCHRCGAGDPHSRISRVARRAATSGRIPP